ncbi:MAG TPA: Rieske 2Fe-2S domain-containing protein [Streptosporangiaceae bacterium]|jgi:vanillate O-demethylase monooxygenase subunit|nr:Rieske 2Fe-2S domain-containing protein [Streptosporangiaceae bacterium]
MTAIRPGRTRPAVAPADCWYVLAPSDSVSRALRAYRVAGLPLVVFRTVAGQVVALHDRCVHRPYPLHAGHLDGDELSCGLCGFVYGPDGQCVRVPTQSRVPVGAAVRAYPVREEQGLVWVWAGGPGRARLHRLPDLPWLVRDGWTTVGGEQLVNAGFLLLHESFADVTKIPVLVPEVSPSVLQVPPPPLDVEVTETTVSLSRRYPPGRLPDWQGRALGQPGGTELEHLQEGHFLSPAAWVDYWDVVLDAGGARARMRFTQLVTPADDRVSRLLWRVSRDFGVGDRATTAQLTEMFVPYYAKLAAALETMQQVIDEDGPAAEVNVSSDVAALRVRQIVQAMLAEENAPARGPRRAPAEVREGLPVR